MGDATKMSARGKSAKSFLRGLAAATCLTAATAGVAHATTINEGVNDFGNTFALRTPLIVGTDLVNGSSILPDVDFFEFSGLAGGGSFDIALSAAVNFFQGTAFTDANSALGTPSIVNFGSTPPQHITGTIPSDGKIVIQIIGAFEGGGGAYTVGLTAPLAATVPEPASALLTGLGAAALALRNLKRRKLNK
jgi:hypothetical protein